LRTVEIRFEKNAYEEYLDLKAKAQNKNSIEARIFSAVEKVLDELATTLMTG
jgi:hypothetical protein